MAHFKISLLTPSFTGNATSFLSTPISEFYTQTDVNNKTADINNTQYSYCHTYDEQFSLHQNAQKELTFKMDRYILLDMEYIVNPFVSSINIGSQILLEDKYHRQFIFIVKNIDFEIFENNITYSVSCQDVFTYQLIRQNDGYTINNDPTSEDYIGAKDVDWWVKNRIHPDCYIHYNYLSLETGLYENESGQYIVYTHENEIKNLVRFIKKPLKKTTSTSDIFEPIPFSLSGSNANAALIALGSEVGLQLVTFEYLESSNKMLRYYWYEPEKSADSTGLLYSPNSDIQSFSLSHNGESLTTVLNVESREVDDELISLLPEIPSFFSSYFQSNEWDNSKYYNGMFTSIVQGEEYLWGGVSSITREIASTTLLSSEIKTEQDIKTESKKSTSTTDDELSNMIVSQNNQTYLYVWLFNVESKDRKLRIPTFYPFVSFTFSETNDIRPYLELQYANAENKVRTQYLALHTASVQLCIFDTKGEYTTTNFNNEPIKSDFLGKEHRVALRIQLNNFDSGVSSFTLSGFRGFIKFYRESSQDELDFASMADKCPWLENKIINLSYFYDHNIINKFEYQSILDTLNNRLRIVNGRLLYYSKNYYDSVKEKVKNLAAIQERLDSLGAACAGELVDKFRTSGSISTDLKYLDAAYKNAFLTNIKMKTPLSGYYSVLNDTISKYFDSQQRFLRNIYKFRQYWETPYTTDPTAAIATDHIIINNTSEIKNNVRRSIGFSAPTFQIVNNTFSYYVQDKNRNDYLMPTVSIYDIKTHQELEVVSRQNYDRGKYYLPSITSPRSVYNGSVYGQYNGALPNYYPMISRPHVENASNITFTFSADFLSKEQEIECYVYTTEGDIDYYAPLPKANNNFVFKNDAKPEDITIEGITATKDGVAQTIVPKIVNFSYIQKHYLATHDVSSTYYCKDTTSYKFVKDEWHDKTFMPHFTLATHLTHYAFIAGVSEDADRLITSVIGTTLNERLAAQYAKTIPVPTLTYYGAVYNEKPSSDGETVRLIRVNEKGWDQNKWDKSEDDNKRGSNPSTYFKYQELKNIYTGNYQEYYGAKAFLMSTTASSPMAVGPAISLEQDRWTVWQKWNSREEFTYISYEFPTDDLYYATRADAIDVYLKIPSTDTKKYPAISLNAFSYDYLSTYVGNAAIYDGTEGEINYGLCYKPKFFEVIKANSLIYNDNNYWIVPLKDDKGKDFLFENSYEIFKDKDSPLLFADILPKKWFFSQYSMHLLRKMGRQLDLSQITWGQSKSKDILEVLKAQNWVDGKGNSIIKSDDGYSFAGPTNSGGDKTATFIVIKECNYWPRKATSDDVDKDLFKQTNDAPLIWATVSDLVKDFWHIDTLDAAYQVVTSDNNTGFNEDGVYYKKTGSGFMPVYTLKYYLKENRAVYLTSSSYSETNVTKYKESFTPPLMIITEEFAQGSSIITIEDSSKDARITCEKAQKYINKKWILKMNDKQYTALLSTIVPGSTTYVYTFSCEEVITLTPTDFNNIAYGSVRLTNSEKIRCASITSDSNTKITKVTSTPYNGIFTFKTTFDEKYTNKTLVFPTEAKIPDDATNDEIHFTYKIEMDDPVELSLLNNGAFWFNYHKAFAEPILQEKAARIETDLTIYWQQAYNASLYCNYFLPEYWQSNAEQEMNYFASYVWSVLEVDNNNIATRVDLNDRYVPQVRVYTRNGQSKLPKYDLSHIDSYSLSDIQHMSENNLTKAADVVSDFTPYIQLFNDLEEDIDNWLVQESGSTVYYYSEGNSGLTWSDFIYSLVGENRWPKLSGIYKMQFNILNEGYYNQEFGSYTYYLDLHNKIWSSLYREHPGILLEGVYSSDSATTSEELYQMALLSFKDLSYPERAYNISVIDVASLKHYHGQELKIGDNIALNQKEYYDEYDDLSKSLSQFLFITDISYSLRSDADINLTVNTIKYQDKLIQSLARLIK